MQKSGWIERQVNEQDRRKVNIYLTGKGQEISQQMNEARQEMTNKIFGVLSEEEQAQFRTLLLKLAVGMEEIGCETEIQ